MEIIENRCDYAELEQEICGLYVAKDGDTAIDSEFAQLQAMFASEFPLLETGSDYEFTDWHSNLRMLWVYLYSDQFYEPKFLGKIKAIVDSQEHPWFAQFECYSPSRESAEYPGDTIGNFLLYKDSVIFNDDQGWGDFPNQMTG